MSELFTGNWISEYSYMPSGTSEPVTSGHVIGLEEVEGYVQGESLPQGGDGDGSVVSLSLAYDPENRVLTGQWHEATARSGIYQGDVFHGSLQLIVDEAGDQAKGKWVGYNSARSAVKCGEWVLRRAVAQEA